MPTFGIRAEHCQYILSLSQHARHVVVVLNEHLLHITHHLQCKVKCLPYRHTKPTE